MVGHYEKPPANFRAVTRFTWSYLRADWLRAAGFVTGMFTHVVLTVASTRLIGLAVEHAGKGAGLDTLGLDLAAILGVLLAAIGARWLSDRAINRHTAEAMAAIVASGFTKVQAFDTSWHADNFAGATARKITRAAQGYDMLVSCCYFFFLPSILLVLVTAGTIAPDSALAAATMLAGSAVYFAVITWYNRTRVMPLMTAAFAQDSRITGELVDVLGNNAAVKAWATERAEEARLRHTVGQWCDKLVDAWNGAVNSDQLQTAISAVILVGPIAIVLLQARFGLVDAGTVATVIGSGFVLRGWLGNIGRGVREAQNAVSEMTELVALLGRVCEADQDRGLLSFTPGRGGIRFEQIGFRYADAGASVFEDLSLDIAPGQTVALVGPSGGGKSSFVKLLLGLYRPQQGRILIDGQDIAACTRASVRQAIALVPQDPALFHRTIADNLAYGAPGSTRTQIHEAARRARLEAMIENLRHGYETLVGERGIKLSGGERQRVAIARALAAARPVLVFDEATSSLDTANEHAIQQALQQAMAGRTTIIVAHRLSTVRHADRILVFDRGRIVEDGTHAELSNRPGGLYARLLSVDPDQAAA
ncbi:MAG: ABC transporter ATP-binding protein [Aliidongia sp.]